MPAPTSALPTLGSPNSTEDPKVRAALAELQTILTGGVDTSNLAGSVTSALGLSGSGRGKTNIATTESRTNTAYGVLTTPDRVPGIVLPADALLAVAYQATWQESVGGAARAAIFIGANQTVSTRDAVTNTIAAFTGNGTAAIDAPLFTVPTGLASINNGAVAYTGDVTTGQAVGATGLAGSNLDMQAGSSSQQQACPPSIGGVAYFFAAAGTYDVSVQFKASSGSVTAKNRKLWVWTVAF